MQSHRALTEKGNITFYLAFVMPISLALLIIVIDISQWQFLREEAQREADKIALEVASYLPSQTNARNAFNARAGIFNQRSPNLKISLDTTAVTPGNNRLQAGEIQVSISGQHESMLDSLIAAVTGQEVVFPVNQTASARIVPYDVMLVFSDAISMRPGAFVNWGNQANFPASDYFNQISLPKISVRPPPVPPRAWPDWWNPIVFNSVNFQRWSTQLCFNPATIPLKQSALSLVDSIAASAQNRIGVYSTPGDLAFGAGFTFIKELSFVNDVSKSVRWSNYFEPEVPNSDEGCLLYSHDSLGLTNYPIPENTSKWDSATSCPQIIVKNPFQNPNGHYPNPISSSLSNCYTNGGAGLRDAIFYHAVRMHPHQPNASNVAQALRGAVSRLVEEEKVDPSQSKTLRRGLVGSANKILVLISDAIPAFNEPEVIEAMNALAADKKLKIYIFAYNHQELPVSVKDFNSVNIIQYQNSNERLFAREVNEASLPLEIKSILANEKRVVLSS